MRKAGDDNNGGAVVNTLVANVGGMIVECSGDGVGRGVCGGKGGRNRAGLDEARGWSAAGTNSRLATLMMCFGVIVVILARATSSIQWRKSHSAAQMSPRHTCEVETNSSSCYNHNNTRPRPHTRPAAASSLLNASRRLAANAAAPKGRSRDGPPSSSPPHNLTAATAGQMTNAERQANTQSPPSQPLASVIDHSPLLPLLIALCNVKVFFAL